MRDIIADRMSLIDASGIRKVFDLAKNMKDPVNLSIGQPDFDVHDDVKESAITAIKEGHNKYTQTQGIEELREKIAERMHQDQYTNVEEVLITSGVSGGIFLSYMALINPGDEVLMPDPYFVMYKHLLKLIGGVPVFIDTYPDFKLHPEKVKKAITPKTKALIFSSPANPTGISEEAEDLEAIAKVAEDAGIIVISDEIYKEFNYHRDYVSIAQFYPNTLVLDGFSKSFAMTGWRLGYAAGEKNLIHNMAKLQQYSFVCAPSFAQKAGLMAIATDVTAYIKEYRKKRDLIYEGIKDYYTVNKPDGAFYIFPEAPNGDGDAFVEEAIKNNLLVIPGSVFSEKKTHFRISFAASDTTIHKGVDILQKLAQ